MSRRLGISTARNSGRARESTSVELGTSSSKAAPPPTPPLIKVALVGDSAVGKTSLMVRYVEGTFDETQLPTQGVNFSEKTIDVDGHDITFSVWDIGGSHFESMLPLVCNDAHAVLLMFDLCRHESLQSIRKWHEKARGFNKCAVPFLVGCKFDLFTDMPEEEQRQTEELAQSFAKAIRAPLIFCAPSVPINVISVFKVILIQLFSLNDAVPQLRLPGQPLLLYDPPDDLPELDAPAAAAASSQRAAPSSPASAPPTPGSLPPTPPPNSDLEGAVVVNLKDSCSGCGKSSMSESVVGLLPSKREPRPSSSSRSIVSQVSANYAAQYGV